MKGPVDTPIGKTWIGDDGIAYAEFLPNVSIDREKALVFFEECKKLSEGKANPVLLDVKNAFLADREARLLFSSDLCVSITRAAAVLINSPVAQVVASFFMGLNKPPFPVRLFSRREEALEWLKGFVQ
ncbi:MAG: hypothetical protein ABIB65_05550 [Candidatus Margulisiibacteriota bacterium]